MPLFTDRIEAKDFPKMPKEYQDLLVRVLTIQTDSELGGPDLYVERWIRVAPTAEDQMLLAKTAAEEIDHHRKFRNILAEIGVDVSYLLKSRREEKILETFRYPLETWAEMGMFGLLIDRVGGFHLHDFAESTYLPLARIIPDIVREEKMHIWHGLKIIRELCQTEEGKAQAQAALDKMYPRALDMFGLSSSRRSDQFKEWGIKQRTNQQCRLDYIAEVDPIIEELGLRIPDPLANRKYL